MPYPLPFAADPRLFVDAARSAGLRVEDDAVARINELLVNGVQRSGGLSSENLQEMEKAYRVLTSAAITAAATDHVDFIGSAHIKRALGWICPLFPFC